MIMWNFPLGIVDWRHSHHQALIGYSLEPGYDRFRPPSGSKIDLGFVLYVEEVFKVSMMKASLSDVYPK